MNITVLQMMKMMKMMGKKRADLNNFEKQDVDWIL